MEWVIDMTNYKEAACQLI